MSQIESLALFPLSDVVLLPEVSVPLYLFEPRYRQMTRDALAGTHQIGMVTVRPDSVDAISGDPPVFEIGCLGRIAHAQERPDGTYQIMRVGESRFRILEEEAPTAERLYRLARVELIPDHVPETATEIDAMNRSREELLSLLERLVRHIGSGDDPKKATETFARLESSRLVNALTQSLSFSPIERQQLLEAESILGRFETMANLLRFRLAELGSGESGSTRLPN
jgi:Lon protease-like protein